jgi:hypothetical protein
MCIDPPFSIFFGQQHDDGHDDSWSAAESPGFSGGSWQRSSEHCRQRRYFPVSGRRFQSVVFNSGGAQ